MYVAPAKAERALAVRADSVEIRKFQEKFRMIILLVYGSRYTRHYNYTFNRSRCWARTASGGARQPSLYGPVVLTFPPFDRYASLQMSTREAFRERSLKVENDFPLYKVKLHFLCLSGSSIFSFSGHAKTTIVYFDAFGTPASTRKIGTMRNLLKILILLYEEQ